MHGFDQEYFVQQVAGLSQLAGELMLVRPLVIDLGWGKLKSALVKLPDSALAKPAEAAESRKKLMEQYVDAFRKVDATDAAKAREALKGLAASVGSAVAGEMQSGLKELLDGQMAKLG
jgi:hypothetical protein